MATITITEQEQLIKSRKDSLRPGKQKNKPDNTPLISTIFKAKKKKNHQTPLANAISQSLEDNDLQLIEPNFHDFDETAPSLNLN